MVKKSIKVHSHPPITMFLLYRSGSSQSCVSTLIHDHLLFSLFFLIIKKLKTLKNEPSPKSVLNCAKAYRTDNNREGAG